VEIELSAKVIDNSGRIVAARVFRSTAPIAQLTGPDAAVALDRLMTPILAEIVRWVGNRA
jgi:ABC-type uncharacterized transport system auxiliary subunit